MKASLRRCIHNNKRVTLISPLRGRRPRLHGDTSRVRAGVARCPFCPGSESETPRAVLVLRRGGSGGIELARGPEAGSGDWVPIFPAY